MALLAVQHIWNYCQKEDKLIFRKQNIKHVFEKEEQALDFSVIVLLITIKCAIVPT